VISIRLKEENEKKYIKAVDLLEKILNSPDGSSISPEEYQRGFDYLNELLISLVKEKKYEEAIELCDRLNKIIMDNWQLIMPNSPFKEFVFDTVGAVYLSRREYEKARQTYENILKLKNTSSQTKFDAYFKLGIIHEKLNQSDKSIHFLKKALSEKMIPPQKKCVVLSHLSESYVISKEGVNTNEMLKIIKISRDVFENYFYDTCLVLFSISELAKVFYLVKEKDMYNLCFVLLKTIEKLAKEDKNRLSVYQKLCNNSIIFFINRTIELDKVQSSTSYKIGSKIKKLFINKKFSNK